MLQYNEIRPGKIIVFEGTPHEVLSSHVFRKQQRKPVNAAKLKNLLTGKVFEYSFHQAEKAGEADLIKKEAKFLYSHRGEYWFCEVDKPSQRFQLPPESIGEKAKFLKPNNLVEIVYFGDKIIAVKLPIKVELKVTEAPPGIKGDTAAGGQKQIILETGAVINAPLFVNEGDTVRINTETGEYVERV